MSTKYLNVIAGNSERPLPSYSSMETRQQKLQLGVTFNLEKEEILAYN